MKFLITLIFAYIFPAYMFAQVNVKSMGAKGDGTTDDTEIIQRAIIQAKKNKQYVFFPKGTYIVDYIEVSSSLVGESGTIIKKKVKPGKLERYNFVKVSNQKNLEIRRITFDGSAQGKNEWEPTQGAIPLYVISSDNIKIENCTFLYSPMSGLRVENSRNIYVKNSISEKSRGNFGDGYYFTNVIGGEVDGCIAEDFTRIGFVTENKTRDMVFKNSKATNGHHASILTGGTEYNGGFWYENSGNITTINCKVKNVKHRGFTAVTGAKTKNLFHNNVSYFNFDNCDAENVAEGFVISSGGGVAIVLNIDKSVIKKVSKGIVVNAVTQKDNFKINGVQIGLLPITTKSKNVIGIMWEGVPNNSKFSKSGLPKIEISNTYVTYPSNSNWATLRSNANNNGDISTYAGGKVNMIINNHSNSLGNSIIKSRRGVPSIKMTKTKYESSLLKSQFIEK